VKQLLQDARSGEISVAEVPAPQLLPGCVLVRTAASVISPGTERASAEFAGKSLAAKALDRPDLARDLWNKVQRDGLLSAWQSARTRLERPQSLGYSSAGSVLAVGGGVTGIGAGDRVACAGAGYAAHAEVVCVPRLLTAVVPRGSQVPFDQAAFATLGAVALHGIRTAGVQLGDNVAVIGLGLMGQLTVQLLKAAGATVFAMDLLPARAELALRSGARAACAAAAEFRDLCAQLTRGHGVDSVVITAETAGSDPVNLASVIARDRGTVVAVGTIGLNLERRGYYEKELDFRISRSYGPGRYDSAYEQGGRDYPIGYVRWTETRNMEAFLGLLADNKLAVGSLITHRLPIERAREAYALIHDRASNSMGLVLTYEADSSTSQRLEPGAATPVDAKGGQPVSVGVLGAGSFASAILLPAIRKDRDTTLVAVCAATGPHSRHAGQKFGCRYSTTNEREVLGNAGLNTVVVATRHHLHARQVIAALEAGKHVFCEKPLCLTREELAEIAAAFSPVAGKLRLMVDFNRRFAPMAQKLKEFLTDVHEPLAMSYRVNAGALPADHWINDPLQGGGRILGEICHFIDLLSFLAGSPVAEVQANPLASDLRYSHENLQIALRMASGSQGTITYVANGDRAYSKERLEVFGGGATAVLDDFRRLDLVRHGRKQTTHSRLRQDKGHQAAWAAFSASVREGKPNPIPWEEIVRSTLATFGAAESAATGKAVLVDAGSIPARRPPSE
jgi:predicted dehydrogenase/threonine dehydrogenase-like Zn-dependent dehydrogenase